MAGEQAGRPGEAVAGDRVARPEEELTFDEALAELERTVAELEAGGLPLERTIALYERGVGLQQRCEALLADADLRVRRLVEGARGAVAEATLRDVEDEA